MKANLPRGWFSLPKHEQKAISEAISAQFESELNRLLDEEHIKLQKIFLKICCIILHDNFGWGEGRCSQFLGSWKGMARKLKKLPSEEAQAAFIAPKIEEIFKKGYPDDFIEKL